MIPVNLVLGTNYLFICEKPLGDTPLNYFGPWPWYIIPLALVSILAFFGLYSPYAIADGFASRSRATQNAKSGQFPPA